MKAKTESQSISQEYNLPHPPAKVWRALTEPKLIGEWLTATSVWNNVGVVLESTAASHFGFTKPGA